MPLASLVPTAAMISESIKYDSESSLYYTARHFSVCIRMFVRKSSFHYHSQTHIERALFFLNFSKTLQLGRLFLL